MTIRPQGEMKGGTGRRLYLRVLVKGLAVTGIVAVLGTFAASLFSVDHKVSSVSVDVTRIRPGTIREVDGLARPVWVLRRTAPMIARLSGAEPTGGHELLGAASVGDPSAIQVQEPIHPEYFVFVPYFRWVSAGGEWIGELPVRHLPARDEPVFYAGAWRRWDGGFSDAGALGLYFDYAGRVFDYSDLRSVSRVYDLESPPHEWSGNGRLVIRLED